MKKIDMTNVQEAGEFTRLPAGAYECTITAVEDVADREYLKVSYDIATGEFANYYGNQRAEHPDWAWVGAYVKSYKTKALPMFKRFCSAVSKSNGSFVFDGNAINADEKTLVGKKIGLVLREEEYYSNSGDLRTRLIVHKEFPVDQIDKQKVPDVKKLEGTTVKYTQPGDPAQTGFMTIPDNVDEVPF